MESTTSGPKKAASIQRKRDHLESFNEIWYQIFLYCLATVMLMHILWALFALRALRKHRLGRYLPIVIAFLGFLYPITGGILTSCCIAWVYSAANYPMEIYFAFFYGAGQAFFLLLVSYVHLYGTL